MINEFIINEWYTFYTKAPTILGNLVENVRLKSIMDYESAKTYTNVDVKHNQIQPILIAANPTDDDLLLVKATSLVYYCFKTINGDFVVLADNWIDKNNANSNLIQNLTFNITIPVTSSSDKEVISKALKDVGFTTFTITEM